MGGGRTMRCALQRRRKMQYAYYEDQVKNALPKSQMSTPTFTNKPKASAKWGDVSYSDQFYQTKDVNQAVQFMQAGSTPEPKNKAADVQGYTDYLNHAMRVGTEEEVAPQKQAERRDGPPQREPTREEIEAYAKKVSKRSNEMGRKAMDRAASTSWYDDPDDFADTIKSVEVPEGYKPKDLDYITKHEVDEEKERRKAEAPPEYDELKIPGKTEKEKQENFCKMMEDWEKRDRMIRNPAVEMGKKHRQEGAPITTNWTKSDESHFSRARNAFFAKNLQKPGWTNENFGVMYAAERGKTNVGTVPLSSLRGPGWQL
eukprot:TRINITY_DN27505_c0_g1_i1.p1 TRINITY_DN27505_c0_g1~~TRINITY_DN27505_c0_g1_i1.p1  ORF type:complete len:315 (+),score=119.56 TRINITY_DN27505_c0_g1_i1:57-1001(+)